MEAEMSDELRVDVYLPLYVRDFLTSTYGWTAEERGHYLTLLMLAWDRGSLPAELEHLERLSPGVTSTWPLLADKFPLSEDGNRRNPRLEKHRTRCVGLKEKRVNAAKRAAAARASAASAGANAEQTLSNRGANAGQSLGNREPNAQHPTPTPTSTPTSTSSKEEKNTTRHGGEPGWALDEWEKFVAVWNRTGRAKPWTPLMPPDGWADHAASPGWLSKAQDAMSRLPACEWFKDPVAVTRFFEYVDRILAGEFDTAKHDGREHRRRQPAGGNL
jgi:uncharacterized protein YdaU (DUF1376 family)